MVGEVVVGIAGGFEWVVVGDECVVVGGGDECVVVGAGAEAVVVGDAGAVGVGADEVVVGAGAEDVVTGAADDVLVGEVAAVVVGLGFGLGFLWWTCFFFGGSCFLVFVVFVVLVAAAGVLVELLLEPPEPPQTATITAIAMAEIKARFIGWTPLRSQTCSSGYKCFRRPIVAVRAGTARPASPPGRLSRIGPPSRPMSSRHDLKGEDGISRPDDRRR